MGGNPPQVSNFNPLFLKLDWFICDQSPVLPKHSIEHYKATNGDDLVEFEKQLVQKLQENY